MESKETIQVKDKMKKSRQIKILLLILLIGFFVISYGKTRKLVSYYLIKIANNEILSYMPANKNYNSTLKPDFSIGYATFKNSMGKIAKQTIDESGKIILEAEKGNIVISKVLPFESPMMSNKESPTAWIVTNSEDNEITLKEMPYASDDNKYLEMRKKCSALSTSKDFNKDIFFVQPKSFLELLCFSNEDFKYYIFLLNEKIKAIKNGKYEYVFFATQTLRGRLDIIKKRINNDVPDVIASFGDVSENKWQVVQLFSKDDLALKEFETILATFRYRTSNDSNK